MMMRRTQPEEGEEEADDHGGALALEPEEAWDYNQGGGEEADEGY